MARSVYRVQLTVAMEEALSSGLETRRTDAGGVVATLPL
jgi:hypothetical protein